MSDYVSRTWSSADDIEKYFAKNAFDPKLATWILFSGTEPAGRLTRREIATGPGTKALLLDNLHVDIPFQGKGVGSAAIRELILAPAHFLKIPAVLLVLKTNPAKALYERLDFRVVGESPYRYSLAWNAPEGFAWVGDPEG